MPTDEFRPMLERAEVVREAQPIIEVACPLLRELVNASGAAFQRCQGAPINRGGEHEELAPTILYRHMIELVDGIEVLFASSCVQAAVPLVRATFEASLALKYILADNYTQRSLSWTCGHVHSRISDYQRLDRSTLIGADHAVAFERELNMPPTQTLDSSAAVENLRQLLCRSEFVPIEAEYQRTMKARRKKHIDWYELFDGPKNRRLLAKSIGEEAQYLGFYGEWSRFSHAASASAYLTSGNHPKEAAFYALRTPLHMPRLAFLTASYLLNATRLMTTHFRGGEDLRRWYEEDVKPRWDELRTLRIVSK